MVQRRLAPGTVLSGRYQVAEVIGESDLSSVYAATDQRGNVAVALKVFDQAVMARSTALSEYQALARQASGLGVEGIARAYDFGIDANSGVPFSTAERISWGSIDRRVMTHGPLGVLELSRALSVLGRALDAAHTSRIVHRDLKPQNVFISPDNAEWVRITDFGVSAVRRGAPEAMGWGGPPGYTPPEAVDAAAAAQPGCDLFALGVLAFFALTRGTPFRSLRSTGFDPNAHWSELNQPLHPLSERAKEMGVSLDRGLDPWFARALALKPEDRFRSAGEMSRELAAVADQLAARGAGGERMPGIAAAIAQPLVFQPERSGASLSGTVVMPVVNAPPRPGVSSPPRPAAGVSSPPRPAAGAPPPPPATSADLSSTIAGYTAPAPAPRGVYSPPPPPEAAPPAAPVVIAPFTPSVPAPALYGAVAQPSPMSSTVAEDTSAFVLPKKRSPLPFLIAGGVLLLVGSAAGAYALFGNAKAGPVASASAAPSAAPTPPPSAVPATTGPAKARFTCQPEACEWVVCDGKNIASFNDEVELPPGAHDCSASRNGYSSKAVQMTASPGQVSPVLFELLLLPVPEKPAPAAAAPKPVAAAPKPVAVAATPKPATPTVKPATPAPSAKPATTSKPTTKKKCSPFLGCK